MKTLHAGIIAVLVGGGIALTLNAQDEAPPREQPTVVVGTFDSRAVAMASVRSGAFNEYLRAQQAAVAQAIERADAAGDVHLASDLRALGPAMQKRIHEQGFGSAPVDDILAKIEEKLPAIAKEAGVDVIVSKWTLTYSSPEARFIDVTELLAAEFDPDESTLRMIREIVTTEPIPLDELDHDH
jgi:hypothetical protein